MAPQALLRRAAGGPRGLWARGERWVAHRGVLAELRVGDATASERFQRIMTQLAGLPEPAATRGRVRLYGGFAFGAHHREEDDWDGFPAALFHLPDTELTGDASGRVRLRLRALAPPDEVRGTRRLLEERAESLRTELASTPPARPSADSPIEARLTAERRDRWEAAVEEVLGAIARGSVSKVVLARTLDVEAAEPVDPVRLVTALRRENPNTHVFLFEPRPGRVLVGAAPEAVTTVRSGVFHATAVAGSVPPGDTPEEGLALARRLLDSAKDRAEQRIVVDDMVSRLEPMARDVKAEAEPHVLSLARIQHLETEIRARVQPGRSVLDLVAALHPTPAVCGVPREQALALLEREEPFRRGWYAGPVGWFTLDGDGHFVPALRTAVGGGRRWRLFAGAGIVEGSEPAAEWAETGIKFLPVLRALAASGVALPEGLGDSGAPGPGSGSQRDPV